MRLGTFPCLSSRRRTFPMLLLIGAWAAARAQEMTPAASKAAWWRAVAFLTHGVV